MRPPCQAGIQPVSLGHCWDLRPRLRSTVPELGRTRHRFQNARTPCLPQHAHSADLGHKTQRGSAACLGWHSRHQDADPRPWHLPHCGTAPQLLQEGWRMVGGPGARRLGWGAGWPLAPPPPQAPQPGSIHPAAQLPAHPPRPRHQSTPGPLLPLSFWPSSSLPNSSLFFFPLLSLFQHVITVETKSSGTMRALMAAPSRLPPPVVRASTLSTRPGLELLPKEPY